MAAGKHVYVEKSFAPTLGDTQVLLQAARQHDVAVMEGYMFLYHRQQAQVKVWLDEGRIGDLRHFHGSFGFPPLPADDFRWDEAVGGGVLMDAAGYPLRAARLLLGHGFEVQAASVSRRPGGTTTWGSAYLSDGAGLGASIAFGFENFYQCRYELWGSLGKLTAERAYTPAPTFSPRLILETADGVVHHVVDADNHFVGALREFSAAISNPDRRIVHYRDIEAQSRSLDRIRELAFGD